MCLKQPEKMHVSYKFGLFIIFIIFSVSISYTRAAPATNQTSSYDDDYPDDYDYYDDHEQENATKLATTTANRLMQQTAETITTTPSPFYRIIDLPKRSNHVLEPFCPKPCFCLEDYKYIQCSNARLSHVPKDLPSTALIIDLSHNNINKLDADDFANCSKVREINLSHNELTNLNSETFEGLERLQRLRLNNNRLTQMDPDTLAGATDLSALDLSNNSIALRSDGSFLNQPSLLEFSCRNCSWTELYEETFANLSSLTALKLDQNDFNKKINTRAFTPLRNLIKLRLPELDQDSIQELCNLLKSIDNISFKHFDVSCFELVLGTSFNESLILATDPPFKAPTTVATVAGTGKKPTNTDEKQQTSNKAAGGTHKQKVNMTENSSSNLTLPINSGDSNDTSPTVMTANVLGNAVTKKPDQEEAYQVSISQEAINIMLISIMIIAIIGLLIGIICRKDIGGIKTKCCRTRKPEPKDQVHPTEEIPLNKLA